MFFPMIPQNPVQFQFQQSSPPRRSSSRNLSAARQLIGRHVKVNRGGPDSLEGVLLAVNGSVLVLNAKGTIVYVNGNHVKSITEGKSGGKSGGASGQGRRSMGSDGAGAAIINASTINGVLSAMHQRFIQINSGGPEKLEGFLAQINSDFILIIVGREFVRVPIFHIKTVNLSNKSGSNKSNRKSGGGSSGNRQSSGAQNRSSSGRRNRTSGSRRNRNRGR